MLRSIPFCCLLFATQLSHADIFQWEWIDPLDTSLGKRESTRLVPDGAGAIAEPGANFFYENLRKAYLIGANLSDAFIRGVNLIDADLTNANLSNADISNAELFDAEFANANLSGTDLSSGDLTNANFAGANLSGANLFRSTLTNTDFARATVRGVDFGDTGNSGFTAALLHSTLSYQTGDLQGIKLTRNNLTGWNFAGQNLTDASFYDANLTDTDFIGAEVRGASFYRARGFSLEDLYSTSSYQAGDLHGIGLGFLNFSGVNFAGCNLTDSYLYGTDLTDADFTGAIIDGAIFSSTVKGSRGFTAGMLYSSESYQSHNLKGIHLRENNLTGWDFAGQNLTGASFYSTTLTDAVFDGSVVRGANFSAPYFGRGLTAMQLYSTFSYQASDLQGIGLADMDLTDWNFAGQNLSDAVFLDAILTRADFAGADLTNANFWNSTLTDADFTGADVRGANFRGTTYRGFTAEQFYSTSSYQLGDLRGISLESNDLSGWNFAGLNLTESKFSPLSLADADFTGADTRGASGLAFGWSESRNSIRPNGHILAGLEIRASETMRLWDYDGEVPIPILVEDSMSMDPAGTLRAVFEADEWGSTILFEAGIEISLAGTLLLEFADDVNLADQLGRRIRLFDWTGVSPSAALVIESPYIWDLSELFTSGNITLIDIPQLPGDFDGDQDVDGADFLEWQRNPGIGSLVHWEANFSADLSEADINAVPAPSTISLLIAVLLVLGTWPQRSLCLP